MTSEFKQLQELGNVFLVGLELDSGGKELLTWALAKLAQKGDCVIALHVVLSASQADATRNTVNVEERGRTIEAITGFYQTFCSIKQVDLQVKITRDISLKRALIEEANKINARKLVLGHLASQPYIGTSFSLAKHCSKRLPMTCSVVVIQQGRVVFEREGYLNTSGKGNSRVLDAIQRTLKSHSRKHSNTSLDGRTKCLSSPSVETVMSHNDPGIIPCQWPLPVRFLDSPVNILQLRNRLSCKTRTMNPLDSPLSTSSPTPFSMEQNQGRAVSVCKDGQNDVSSCRQSLEDCFSQSEGSDNINDEAYATSGGKSPESSNELILSSSNQNRDFKSCTVKVGSDLPVTTTGSLQDKKPKDSISSFVGWPLLRKHFRANLNNSKLKTRRLSVAEWTFQLPERPRNVSHQAEPQKIDSFTSFFYRSNGRICHDHPVIRDGSNGSEADYLSQYLEVDSIPQYYEDRLELRISKLSGMKPCKRFQLKDLQEATEGFASESIVGRGGCSQVYKGLIWEDTRVAVKCLNGSANEDEFFTEIEMLCNLKHDNIVQLIGYYIDRQRRMLVYNFASEGNLEQKLHGGLLAGKSMALLTWRARHNIAVGVANALEYLHDCHTPVIHMDVKSSNILLCSDLKPQLTDFGLAKLLPATSMQITCSDVVGTFGYLAPEYFMFGKVSQKTDVYSFGVVLLELITGRRAIDNTRAKGEENLVLWARPLLEDESNAVCLIDPGLKGSYDAGQLKNMMVAAALCLRRLPHARPCMSEILKLLKGEVNDFRRVDKEDPLHKELGDGCDMPNYDEMDIGTHLSLALHGIHDDDIMSQASIEHSLNLAHSNKSLEEYLGGRYSRSNSFE